MGMDSTKNSAWKKRESRARRTVSVSRIQALEGAHSLLAHLAPRPAALHHRLAPRLKAGSDRLRTQRAQLLLLRREVRLARLQLALRGRELGTDLHLGLHEAERGGRARGRQERVAGGFLVLGGLNQPRHPI